MAIEINNNVPPASSHSMDSAPRAQTQATEKDIERQRSSNSSAPATATDQVSLTPAAQKLQALAKAVADEPVVDTSRVNTIKEAIISGRFEVDAESIADKLTRLEKALNDMS
jgi:negative regulator of flagellin synthesis FlgM